MEIYRDVHDLCNNFYNIYRIKKNQTSTPHTKTCLILLYSIDVKLLHYLVNSCQNKFGLFDQFTWRKKSEGSAQSVEVYFKYKKGERNANNFLSKIVVTGNGETFSFDEILLIFLVQVLDLKFSCSPLLYRLFLSPIHAPL